MPRPATSRIVNTLGLLNVWSELRLTAVTSAAILSIPGEPGHTVSDQPSLMPTVLMTLLHFSVSSAGGLPKSAGEPAGPGPAKSVNLAFNLGSSGPALIS